MAISFRSHRSVIRYGNTVYPVLRNPEVLKGEERPGLGNVFLMAGRHATDGRLMGVDPFTYVLLGIFGLGAGLYGVGRYLLDRTRQRQVEESIRRDGKVQILPFLIVRAKETAPFRGPQLAFHPSRVQGRIREVLGHRFRSHSFRDAIRSPLKNVAAATLWIGLERGEVWDEEPDSLPTQYLRITVIADLENNRFFLQQGDQNLLKGLIRHPPAAPSELQVGRALLGLDGAPLLTYDTAKIDPPDEKVPGTASNRISQIRTTLRERTLALSEEQLTRSFGLLIGPDIEPHRACYVGTITLNRKGEAIATSLHLPPRQWAKGTIYTKGIVKGGVQVPVVIAEPDLLLHWEGGEGLTPLQNTILTAYYNSENNQGGLQRAAQEHPYSLDLVLGRSPGLLLHEFEDLLTRLNQEDRETFTDASDGLIAEFKGSFVLMVRGGEYHFCEPFSPSERQLHQENWNRICLIEFTLQLPALRLATGTYFITERFKRTGQLIYQIVEGKLPIEVRDVLDFLGRRVARIYHRAPVEDPDNLT